MAELEALKHVICLEDIYSKGYTWNQELEKFQPPSERLEKWRRKFRSDSSAGIITRLARKALSTPNLQDFAVYAETCVKRTFLSLSKASDREKRAFDRKFVSTFDALCLESPKKLESGLQRVSTIIDKNKESWLQTEEVEKGVEAKEHLNVTINKFERRSEDLQGFTPLVEEEIPDATTKIENHFRHPIERTVDQYTHPISKHVYNISVLSRCDLDVPDVYHPRIHLIIDKRQVKNAYDLIDRLERKHAKSDQIQKALDLASNQRFLISSMDFITQNVPGLNHDLEISPDLLERIKRRINFEKYPEFNPETRHKFTIETNTMEENFPKRFISLKVDRHGNITALFEMPLIIREILEGDEISLETSQRLIKGSWNLKTDKLKVRYTKAKFSKMKQLEERFMLLRTPIREIIDMGFKYYVKKVFSAIWWFLSFKWVRG